ncbi:MAG: AIR synthase related protein [Candidatus Moduliflexus flocculans]|nr:AIR synthase related protein [Candidatus Moduliflexus flocculans]
MSKRLTEMVVLLGLSEQARRRRARPGPGRHSRSSTIRASWSTSAPPTTPASTRGTGGPALVQTVDFFTPIVDDPYTYGQIAAANALSDVYAMGGQAAHRARHRRLPAEGLRPRPSSRAVFRGGFDKLREAGVALLGGHTVQRQRRSSSATP